MSIVLEVTRGSAEPASLLLEEGDAVSLGSDASWRLFGAGVLPEHGFILAKDGILYVKSCNMQNPVLVDEEPMPPEWLAVPLPASLVVGRVTIAATAEGGMYEEDAATMMGKPSQLVSLVPHEAGGADFSEDQPTLIKRDPPERPRPSAPPPTGARAHAEHLACKSAGDRAAQAKTIEPGTPAHQRV
jgi:hypothetical protein